MRQFHDNSTHSASPPRTGRPEDLRQFQNEWVEVDCELVVREKEIPAFLLPRLSKGNLTPRHVSYDDDHESSTSGRQSAGRHSDSVNLLKSGSLQGASRSYARSSGRTAHSFATLCSARFGRAHSASHTCSLTRSFTHSKARRTVEYFSPIYNET